MAERRQRKASLISSAPIEPSTSNSGKPIEAYNSASPEDATSTSTGTGTGPNAGDGANGGTTTSQHKAPSSSSSTTNSTAAAGAQPLSARERKRALDRKAQRASREKTRARIAHLENLVKALSEQHNEAETVQQLLSEIERLTAESEKLRKIIKEIGGLVEEFGDSRAATEAGQSIRYAHLLRLYSSLSRDIAHLSSRTTRNGQSMADIPYFKALCLGTATMTTAEGLRLVCERRQWLRVLAA